MREKEAARHSGNCDTRQTSPTKPGEDNAIIADNFERACEWIPLVFAVLIGLLFVHAAVML
jgi:hypothetical protein